MTDPYFDAVHADSFLSLVLGGIARAGQRHRAKLRMVDEHGNPIGNELPIGVEVNQGDIRYPDDFGPGSIHAEVLAKDRANQGGA